MAQFHSFCSLSPTYREPWFYGNPRLLPRACEPFWLTLYGLSSHEYATGEASLNGRGVHTRADDGQRVKNSLLVFPSSDKSRVKTLASTSTHSHTKKKKGRFKQISTRSPPRFGADPLLYVYPLYGEWWVLYFPTRLTRSTVTETAWVRLTLFQN